MLERKKEQTYVYDPKFTQKTVKHSPSITVWRCGSTKGPGALHFFSKRENNKYRPVFIHPKKLNLFLNDNS